MSNVLKNSLIIVGLLLIVVAGVWMFGQRDATSLSFDDPLEYESMLLETQVFIQRRQELNNIDIETAFFEDARFRSLQSNTESLEPVGVGRDNPFVNPLPSS